QERGDLAHVEGQLDEGDQRPVDPGEEADDEEQAAHDRDRGGMAGARWCGGGRGHRKTSPVWMPFPLTTAARRRAASWEQRCHILSADVARMSTAACPRRRSPGAAAQHARATTESPVFS